MGGGGSRGTPRCCEPACSPPPLPAPRRRPLCLPRPHLRRAVALLPLQIRAGTVALTSYRESGIQAARPRLGVEPLDDLILTAVVRKSPGPFGSGGGARLCREAPRCMSRSSRSELFRFCGWRIGGGSVYELLMYPNFRRQGSSAAVFIA